MSTQSSHCAALVTVPSEESCIALVSGSVSDIYLVCLLSDWWDPVPL